MGQVLKLAEVVAVERVMRGNPGLLGFLQARLEILRQRRPPKAALAATAAR